MELFPKLYRRLQRTMVIGEWKMSFRAHKSTFKWANHFSMMFTSFIRSKEANVLLCNLCLPTRVQCGADVRGKGSGRVERSKNVNKRVFWLKLAVDKLQLVKNFFL